MPDARLECCVHDTAAPDPAATAAAQKGLKVRKVSEVERAARESAEELDAAMNGHVLEEDPDVAGESPVVIRTKDHSAPPMTIDQALYEMELVGHDFFLFVDAETMLPSVVYRRRGWSYGLLRLTVSEPATEAVPAAAAAAH